MDIPQPPPGIKFLSLSKTRISLLGHRETSLKLPILQINFNCRLRNPTSTFLFASIPDLSFDGRLRESARQRREFRRTARLPGPVFRGMAISDGSAFNSLLVCSKERNHSA
ncbi:hypothetical protein [Sinorhizobium fredii]|uniref:hypothetical protein n=1 Tax=Rhizobium fredii TaxID=380 RepID=UPI003515E75F